MVCKGFVNTNKTINTTLYFAKCVTIKIQYPIVRANVLPNNVINYVKTYFTIQVLGQFWFFNPFIFLSTYF